nr:MAG TPA: hypothetical protein [Bacteriophage sp.]
MSILILKICNYVLHLCIAYDIIIVQIKKGQPQRLEGAKYENNRIVKQSSQAWI